MDKTKEISQILKDIKVTNITMVAEMREYDISLKKYMPDNFLKEVFKKAYEGSVLDFEEIDEIRKVYFCYFKCYLEELTNFNLVKINIPGIGYINPNIKDYIKYMERFSKGKIHTYYLHKEVVVIYNKLLDILTFFVDNYKLIYSKFEESFDYDHEKIEDLNKEFKRNFNKRNIRFKEKIISKGILFN